MRLKDKTAIITGGGTGIGLATAHAFYQEGAKIILFGRRNAIISSITLMLIIESFGCTNITKY